MSNPVESTQDDRQLNLFGCDHLVTVDCYQTVPDCWSPYFVERCIYCGEVFKYPDEEFLATWPEESRIRLKKFVQGELNEIK